jgi:microcystin degradation protein MlrC
MKLSGEQIVQARVRIPMIVPAEGYDTSDGPFAALTRECHQLVEQEEILDFSIYQMQPWLDLNDVGGTVLVTAREEETAARYAGELAQRVFALREQMGVKLYTVDEVIDAAKTNKSKMPVILVDSADSPSAGSSADSSFVLARLLERGENIRACLMVADPAAAAHAFELGVGSEGEFTIGGAYEPDFQKSITLRAYVKSLHDGNYFPTGNSLSSIQRTGKTAVLQIGSIDLVVYTRTDIGSDPQNYRAFGVEPSRYQLVMVKSATQYKVYYQHFSTLFYPADTPGSSSANLAAMPFQHVPRPFWPLDPIDSFDAAVTYHR